MIYRWYATLNPEPWTSPTASVGFKNGRRIAMLHKGAKLRNYQLAVQEEYHVTAGKLREPIEGPIHLKFMFSRSTTGRGKPCDLTNLQKALEDGLQGHLFVNDRQVQEIKSMLVRQGPDNNDPFVAVELKTPPFDTHPSGFDRVSLWGWAEDHHTSNASNAFEYWE